MKRTAYISKSILFTVVSLPLLSAFLLTITCSLTNFALPCCLSDSYGHSNQNKTPHSHPASQESENASMDHHGYPPGGVEKGNNEEKGDCCNDLTTAFFSVFQVQPPVFVADQPGPVYQLPSIGTFQPLFKHDVDQSLVYPGFVPPPKIPISGWRLRILHQSFLN